MKAGWRYYAFWLAMLAGLGGVDAATGPQQVICGYFAIPVACMAWRGGSRAGVGAALFGALAFYLGYGRDFPDRTAAMTAWNMGATLGWLLLVVGLVRLARMNLERERALASTDALTGVANRRAFERAAAMETERQRRYGGVFTLVMLDVDGFKGVNDAHGHAAGDALLKAIAVTLQGGLRGTDTVGRLGGDEFALLLPETDGDGARRVVERLRRELAELAVATGWPVGFSLGVLTCAAPQAEPKELMRQADVLLYEVKRARKNDAIYKTILDVRIPEAPSHVMFAQGKRG